MRKLIASINMSIDGYCDHTGMMADDELHHHYTDLLRNAGLLLYGRITYQLMESYWPEVVKKPTGNTSTDDFARAIDAVPKIVYSRTLKTIDWKSATLKNELLTKDVEALKKQPGKDIFVGSPSLIVALTDSRLVDEYQLCVHPVLARTGLPLFGQIKERSVLKLLNTKPLPGSQVVLCYEPVE